MRTFLSIAIAIASLFALFSCASLPQISISVNEGSSYGILETVTITSGPGNLATGTLCVWGSIGSQTIWTTPFTLGKTASVGSCNLPDYNQLDTTNSVPCELTQLFLQVSTNFVGQSPSYITQTAVWSYTPPPPGANGDPHFVGFNGEKMEVKRDENAANQLFHLYCSPSITITTLFYEYPDKLLFMTKFWVRLGETMFTLNLSTKPKMLSANFDGPFYVEETGRNRIEFEGGHMEWDDVMLRVVYGYLKINFSTKVYLNNSPFMNIEFGRVQNQQVETEVTGILGRTLHHKMTDAEFEDYLPYKASLSDVIDFSCKSISNNQLQVEN